MGSSTDDNARALVVVSRQTPTSAGLSDLAAIYLGFVLRAWNTDGRFNSRRDADGAWSDADTSDDSQGRAWWSLGAVARSGPETWMRQACSDAFANAEAFESRHLRANAYAALGAVDMLKARPGHAPATDLAERASGVIAEAAQSRIPWPESRLTYDNARLPLALLAAGVALGDRRRIAIGMRLLEWLVSVEKNGDHFSFTPVGGWESGDPRPAFDQRPAEAWSMAEACNMAAAITGDTAWRVCAVRAARWLIGRNDGGFVLYDEVTGSTSDELCESHVGENRSADATIAGIGALQVAAGVLDRKNPPAIDTPGGL